MTTNATQLSPKPKPLIRPAFIILAVLGLVLGALFFQQTHPRRAVHVPPGGNDPCDLVLVGVRPDDSDDLYAPDGHRLGFAPSINTKPPFWNADRLQRDFIFRVPVPDDSFKIINPIIIHLNGYTGFSIFPKAKTMKCPHSTYIVASVGLPRLSLHPRSMTARMQGGEPVRTVDIKVRFFAGARHRSGLGFSGPFQIYHTYEDDARQGYTLRAHYNHLGSSGQQLYLKLTAPAQRPLDNTLILYRPDGTWKITKPFSRTKTPNQGTVLRYFLQDSGLEQITYIGLNEPTYTRVFRNIVVHYPRRPARTYAPFLDAMASTFKLSARNPDPLEAMLTRKRWSDPNQALTFLPQARGVSLIIATRTVCDGLTIDQLSPAQQQSLRKAAHTWLGTELEAQALALGLWAHWPEFVQPSIERLKWSFLEGQNEWTWIHSFSFQTDPSDAEIRQVAAFLGQSHTPHGDSRRCLIQFLRAQGHRPVAHVALLKLAQSNRPWVWTHLIQPDAGFNAMVTKAWLFRKTPSSARGEARSSFPIEPNVPAVIWQRALALDVIDRLPAGAGNPADAYASIATWLTPAFAQYDPNQFARVVRALARHGDKQRDTPLLGQYLQAQLEQWSLFKLKNTTTDNYVGIQNVVMLLNQWYQLNLGALGHNLNVHYNRAAHYWRDIARTAITWLQTRQDPMFLYPGQIIGNRDVRLIWYHAQHPEQSVIILWSAPPILTDRFDYFAWPSQGHSCSCLIRPDDDDPNHFDLTLSGIPDLPHPLHASFQLETLPAPVSVKDILKLIGGKQAQIHTDPHVNNRFVWERALAPQSLLSGTRLYQQWRQAIFNPPDPNQPRPRVFTAQAPEAESRSPIGVK